MTYFNRFKGKQARVKGYQRTLCSCGYSHRSKLESAVCGLLQERERAKELEVISREKHLELSAAKIKYIVDFECRDLKTGLPLYVEAKGFENERWPIIKKLWRAYGFGPLEIWKGSYNRPRIDEIIHPDGETA